MSSEKNGQRNFEWALGAPPVPRPHHCHARGCERSVPPRLLMCRAHWDLVPIAIRVAVVGNYRRGQCDDKAPSAAWVRAASAAIAAVAVREGRELAGMGPVPEPNEGGREW